MRHLVCLAPLAIVATSLILGGSARAQSAPATQWDEPLQRDGGTERRSPALMIVGYTLAGVGTAGIVAGSALIASDDGIHAVCVAAPCDTSSGAGPGTLFGTILLASGGGVTALGLALGIWGTLRVHGPEAPQPASVGPEVAVGPGAVRARWAF